MSISDSNVDTPLVKKRTNVVTIIDESKAISSISFVSGSVQITEGQPYDVPPSIESEDGVYTITLEAGRKSSEDVADDFTAACGDESKEYAPTRGGGTPDELNFMFAVTISFTSGGSETVYLAQGNSVAMNNWWIGGSSIFSLAVPRLLHTVGNQVYTYALSGDHETFNLKQANVRPVSKIEHVFVLMLENHSFDNMLALSGIPGIKAATTSNFNSYNGTDYYVQSGAPSSMPTDPGHEFADVVEQLAGQGAKYEGGAYPTINNSGFAANYATTTTEGPAPPAVDIGEIMMCFDTKAQLPALYAVASNFVVCDQWFSSLPGPTWPNRFFLHGASSNGLDHSPSTAELAEWEFGSDFKIGGFKYPNGSIFDRMTENCITYRLYHDTNGPLEGSIAQASAIHNIQMWDMHKLSTFEDDVQAASYPYQYTFIEPNYGDVASTYEGGSSEHPIDTVTNGEALITKVYTALRNAPFWESSLLIITYDEHGGFYDHLAPVGAMPPGDGGNKYNESGFLFNQYGVRVPAVVISPLLAQSVDDTIYDHSSVLATLEYLFGLAPLTDRDKSANMIQGVKNLLDTPRTDVPTTLPAAPPVPRRFTLTPEQRAARELEPIPDRSSLVGFLGVLLKADRELAETPAEATAALTRFQSLKTRGDARRYIHEIMAKVEAERARKERVAVPV